MFLFHFVYRRHTMLVARLGVLGNPNFHPHPHYPTCHILARSEIC